jgi:hypothetical protein
MRVITSFSSLNSPNFDIKTPKNGQELFALFVLYTIRYALASSGGVADTNSSGLNLDSRRLTLQDGTHGGV